MKKILILLFGLYTLTSYSQEYDGIYWTLADYKDDIDTTEEITTYSTDNQYTDYSSRINRFYRLPFYVSYWSYYNPYWDSYYHYGHYSNRSFYWWLNRYWGFGWNYYDYAYWYSYQPTYHYAHHHHHYPHLRTSNPGGKVVVNTPRKVTHKNTTPKYERPKAVKYVHTETKIRKRPAKKFNFHPTVPNKTHPDRSKISSPSRVTGPPRKVKMHPSKIQHDKPKTNKSR